MEVGGGPGLTATPSPIRWQYLRCPAVRLGQQAQGPRCWQQERAGRACTATGRNSQTGTGLDRLVKWGGGGSEVLTYRGGGGSQAGSTGSLSYVSAAGEGKSGRYRKEQGQLDRRVYRTTSWYIFGSLIVKFF